MKNNPYYVDIDTGVVWTSWQKADYQRSQLFLPEADALNMSKFPNDALIEFMEVVKTRQDIIEQVQKIGINNSIDTAEKLKSNRNIVRSASLLMPLLKTSKIFTTL